jgi:uncharacterized membrane protein YgcG
MSDTTVPNIASELKAIREDLDYIKKHMVDADTILTKEEERRLNQSLKEYREGKGVSLEDLKKEPK